MFNAFFLPTPVYPEVLRNTNTKSWETPEPEERYFLPFGKKGC
jgi:hypothetical protein